MNNCPLIQSGYCTCYLKPCKNVNDCAAKIITKRNMETVNNLLK